MLRISLTSLVIVASVLLAEAKPIEKSDSKVKASAKATKLDADGKQTVTITLAIDKGWYIYANPTGLKDHPDLKDYEANRTTVTIKAKDKVTTRVKYPAGVMKIMQDDKKKDVQYRAYEGQVVLEAQVQRSAGDASPLEISIAVNACNKNECLFPGVVKLTVP